MSLPVAQVSCTGCDFCKSLLPKRVRLEYVMADGERFQAGRCIGWCYSCNTVVVMEKADIQEISIDIYGLKKQLEEYREIQDGDSSYKENWFSIASLIKLNQNEIDGLHKFAAAIARRKSPARCMSCWGTDAKRLRFNDAELCEDVRHSCGGQFKYDNGKGGVRISYRETGLLLDIEGHPLELED